MKLEFSLYFRKNQISSFIKIRPMGAELFRADGRTDRQTDRRMTDMTQVIVGFGNFANAPKNRHKIGYSVV
jgi:hypothetical protein